MRKIVPFQEQSQNVCNESRTSDDEIMTKRKAWPDINAQLDQLIILCFRIFCVMYLSALSGLVQCTPGCEH